MTTRFPAIPSICCLLFLLACTPKTVVPTEPLPPPTGTILTLIFTVDPALDTLTVTNILKGPGRLRTDLPKSLAEVPATHLLFTFTDDDGRVLRQTSLPYPGPNRYEVPSESGKIETHVVPEAERVISLRTQFTTRMKWLTIRGENPSGRAIEQSIRLR